jgi:hypothetical protein
VALICAASTAVGAPRGERTRDTFRWQHLRVWRASAPEAFSCGNMRMCGADNRWMRLSALRLPSLIGRFLQIALSKLGREQKRAARTRSLAYSPHPEVAAQRPSKDVGRGAGACILRGSRSLSSGRPLRAGPVGSRLRMRRTIERRRERGIKTSRSTRYAPKP